MVKYFVTEYNFDMKDAALLAACFSLPGGVLRAFGGWLSDKYGAYKVTWVGNVGLLGGFSCCLIRKLISRLRQ